MRSLSHHPQPHCAAGPAQCSPVLPFPARLPHQQQHQQWQGAKPWHPAPSCPHSAAVPLSSRLLCRVRAKEHETASSSEAASTSGRAEQQGANGSSSNGTPSSSSSGGGGGAPPSPRLQQTTTAAATQASTSSTAVVATAITSAAGSSPEAIAEQEQELEKLVTTLPVREARYEALVAWVGMAVAFGLGIWYVKGAEKAQEYFAGYLLEQSLSVDNLFVFVMVFNYFKTPAASQNTVLTWGILSAAVLRAVMIVLGVELVQSFGPVLLLFAGILLYSSYQLLAAGDGDDEEDLSSNLVVKLCQRVIKVSESYDGERFFTTTAEGARVATPLLLTLAVIELCDVVFAVDSIPAVFGVTLDPFIIYTSNLFAILSLRALYTFVSTIMSELRYLDKAVAVVLGFIGSKMVLGFVDVEIPTSASLLFVGLVLGAGVAASLLLPEPAEAD